MQNFILDFKWTNLASSVLTLRLPLLNKFRRAFLNIDPRTLNPHRASRRNGLPLSPPLTCHDRCVYVQGVFFLLCGYNLHSQTKRQSMFQDINNNNNPFKVGVVATRSLSPTSVLVFVEDSDTNCSDCDHHHDDDTPLPTTTCHLRRMDGGRKTKKRRKMSMTELTETWNDDRCINLRHHLVCNETVRWISTRRQTLEELRIGPLFEDARAVFTMIDTLPSSITHLDLDLRNILHILPDVFSRLFQPDKQHLTSLSIRLFGDRGAAELSKWLSRNPNLRRLDLRENRIGNMGLQALVGSISRSDHHLEVLDLGCNCIVDVTPLAELLQTNTHLTAVDLSHNWIGDDDIDQLCNSLRTNSSLRRLSLTGCHRITDRGITHLVECLREYNTSLHHIHIQTGSKSDAMLHLKLQHWLGQNRCGRSLLKCEDSIRSPLWPLVFQKNNTDPNVLFDMLRGSGTIVFGDLA